MGHSVSVIVKYLHGIKADRQHTKGVNVGTISTLHGAQQLTDYAATLLYTEINTSSKILITKINPLYFTTIGDTFSCVKADRF